MILRQLERRFNNAFSVTDEDVFVSLMLERIPPVPLRAAQVREHDHGSAIASVR